MYAAFCKMAQETAIKSLAFFHQPLFTHISFLSRSFSSDTVSNSPPNLASFSFRSSTLPLISWWTRDALLSSCWTHSNFLTLDWYRLRANLDHLLGPISTQFAYSDSFCRSEIRARFSASLSLRCFSTSPRVRLSLSAISSCALISTSRAFTCEAQLVIGLRGARVLPGVSRDSCHPGIIEFLDTWNCVSQPTSWRWRGTPLIHIACGLLRMGRYCDSGLVTYISDNDRFL